MAGWDRYEGKRVYVSLKTDNGKRYYSGVVKDIDYVGKDEQDVKIYLITILDKFGSYVSFTTKEIEIMEEEKEGK